MLTMTCSDDYVVGLLCANATLRHTPHRAGDAVGDCIGRHARCEVARDIGSASSF